MSVFVHVPFNVPVHFEMQNVQVFSNAQAACARQR